MVDRILFPPTTYRVDADRGTLREIGGCAAPIVRMNRTDVSKTLSQDPIVRTSINRHHTLLFFCDRCLVDASTEGVERFKRSLYLEAKVVRRVAVASEPPTLAWVRLDKVGQRDAQLNLGSAKLFKFSPRPREV